MSTVSLQEALRIAIQHHQAGQLPQAEAIYRQILQAQPEHADALHLLGVIALQVGQHGVAAELIGKALRLAPNSPDFHGNFGEALRGLGRLEEAATSFRRAIQLNPRLASAYNNLGIVLKQLGRDAEAVASYRQALALNPNYFQALNNLAISLKGLGQATEAIQLYRQALAIKPDSAETCNNLGVALREAGEAREALEHFHRAVTLAPEFADAHEGLGSCLRQLGQLGDAVTAYREAVRLNPRLANAWNNLGVTLKDCGKSSEAIAAYQQALAIQPDLAEAHNNLGIVLKEQGALRAAMLHLQQAISLKERYAEAWNNFGLVLEIQGQVEEAVAAYRQALEFDPTLARAHSNVLFALNYLPGLSAQQIFDEHVRWAKTYADSLLDKAPLPAGLPYAHQSETEAPSPSRATYAHKSEGVAPPPSRGRQGGGWGKSEASQINTTRCGTYLSPPPLPNPPLEGEPTSDCPGPCARRLRIGYVSPDFRQHPVAYFLEAVLAHHNATQFEIFCYSDVASPDAVTARLRALSHQWRDIHGLSDEGLYTQIRQDGIDILVDLAGHTDRNRLFVFARKPAPVQISWIGYFNTTGLRAMDYFISDVYSSPPEISQLYTEKLVRLPHTRFCYHPPECAPPVAPPPAEHNGFVTFGCFNNLAKLNDEVIATWAQILNTLPTSRIVLKALALGDDAVQARYWKLFASHGIADERVVFSGFSPHAEMLGQYGDIDIALDPFPFTGGLTSCEALWMGVPLITLAGETLVSRQSASLLMNLDLPELIANSPQHYVEVAVELARNPSRRLFLRNSLRAQMKTSPLCDANGFTQDLEQIFLDTYRACKEKHPTPYAE